MHRRLLISALACWPTARLLAQEGEPRPRHKISAAQLHQALSARFPVRFSLPGLLELQVSAPALLLLPARNRLGASLQAQASGPALQRMQPGELDVLFAVRYEAADRSLRAHRLEVLGIRLPGVAADTVLALQTLLPALAREVVGEVVLHKFSSSELALTDTMGIEPDQLTVVEDGLVVEFRQKPPR